MSTSPTAGAAPNVPEYSVGELSNAIKKTLETRFDHVRVRGEITEFMAARSGHIYMCLKDEAAKVKAVMWKGTTSRLTFSPEDGLEVVVTGKLTTYGPRSEYQLVIESMEPAGAGALMALLEERRKKLAAEGLFDADRKRPIPYLPTVIGVVTSPTGAVIRDILHRLADRFPRHVLVWPVLVQGPEAAGQVAAAIGGFNAIAPGGAVPRPDVLIVARGGGSLEDLWAFNEEIVVRAAAASHIPLISAVGHETDTTLIDHASDRRAPTPTAAAEMAVPVREDLLDRIAGLERRHRQGARRLMDERRTSLTAAARALPDLNAMLGLRQQRFDELSERLPRALVANTQAHRHRLADAAGGLRPALLRGRVSDARRVADERAARLPPAARRVLEQREKELAAAARVLDSLSYHNVLKRGYAVIRDDADRPVTSSATISPGEALSIEFADGRAQVRATGDDAPKPPPRKKAPAPVPQGDLFSRLLLAAALAIAAVLPARAELRLDGPMTQGGMIIGHGEPGASVTLDGQKVRAAPDGRFVFGFGREAPPSAVLEVTPPGGKAERRTLDIAQRTWDIQRIDGLPPSKVTPDPALDDRLKRERAAIGAARKHASDAMFWAEKPAWPSKGRISGVYGSQRILNGEPKQPHYGVDVAGPKGSPVTAPGAGTVTLAEPDFDHEGGIVIIDHGYGVSSTLIHMERIDVKAGDSVTQGQRIGLLGAAGRASGPHVDWRMNWNGVRLDPALLVSPMPEN